MLLGPQNLSGIAKKQEKSSIFQTNRELSPIKPIIGRKRAKKEVDQSETKSNFETRQASVSFSNSNFV